MQFHDWEKLPHGALDQERLEAFEDMLGLKLPNDFSEWLQVVKGGKPKNTCTVVSDKFGFACFHHIYGLNQGGGYAQLDRMNRILEGNLNDGLIAFADDAGGNKFTISLRPEDYGAVVFWDHEAGVEYALAGNFLEFTSALRNEEEFIPRGDLEKILRKDDAVMLDQWLDGKDINGKDE